MIPLVSLRAAELDATRTARHCTRDVSTDRYAYVTYSYVMQFSRAFDSGTQHTHYICLRVLVQGIQHAASHSAYREGGSVVTKHTGRCTLTLQLSIGAQQDHHASTVILQHDTDMVDSLGAVLAVGGCGMPHGRGQCVVRRSGDEEGTARGWRIRGSHLHVQAMAVPANRPWSSKACSRQSDG